MSACHNAMLTGINIIFRAALAAIVLPGSPTEVAKGSTDEALVAPVGCDFIPEAETGAAIQKAIDAANAAGGGRVALKP